MVHARTYVAASFIPRAHMERMHDIDMRTYSIINVVAAGKYCSILTSFFVCEELDLVCVDYITKSEIPIVRTIIIRTVSKFFILPNLPYPCPIIAIQY